MKAICTFIPPAVGRDARTGRAGLRWPNWLTHLALTDHDSVDRLCARAMDAARDCGVTLIPGVELSCGAQKEIHILGYGFDPYDERVLNSAARTMEAAGARGEDGASACENGVEISLIA